MTILQLKVDYDKFKAAGLQVPIPHGANFNPDDYVKCGAIPVENLENGEYYLGFSRQASLFRWNGERSVFERIDENGSCRNPPLNHFSNFDGTDVFIPMKVLENQ